MKTVSLSLSVVHKVAGLTTSAVPLGILLYDQVHFDSSVLVVIGKAEFSYFLHMQGDFW